MKLRAIPTKRSLNKAQKPTSNYWLFKVVFLLISMLFINNAVFAQLKKFKVEIPIQPRFKISDSIQSFTLLNRSLTPEFINYNKDSLQVNFYRKNFTDNKLILDSVASDSTLLTLGDLLYASGRFDVVIPIERNIPRTTGYQTENAPLDWDYVAEVCKQFNTDALIVLENLAMRTVTNYTKNSEYYNYNVIDTYYASIDFYSRAHWRMYYPKTKEIIIDYNKNQDTLYWESSEYNLLDVFRKLPSIKTASIVTGEIIATNFAKDISPVWKEATRYYYVTKNKEIDESINLAASGNWEKALLNWSNYATIGKKSEQSKIMLNVALALEMTGNIDSAIEWTKRSINTYYREVANHYLKELLIRQKAQSAKK